MGVGSRKNLINIASLLSIMKEKVFLKVFRFVYPLLLVHVQTHYLLSKLLKDDYPVLLEGIHCTYFLYTGELKNKKVFVRLHNVEYEYYEELAKTTNNIFKKRYLRLESFLLKKYEKTIADKCMFIAVSEKDKETYQQKFAAKNIQYLPVFLPFTQIKSEIGSGNFCLYHGNLSVPENEKGGIVANEKCF